MAKVREATVGYANGEDFELLSERYSGIAPDVLQRNTSSSEVTVTRLGSDVIGWRVRRGGEPGKCPERDLTNPTAATNTPTPLRKESASFLPVRMYATVTNGTYSDFPAPNGT